MLQPDHVLQMLRSRFEDDYPDWARGRGSWPMRISLKPPTTRERADNPVACHTWASNWRAYTGPGTVEYTNLRFPTATHSMPKTLRIDRPTHVAAATPETRQTWQQCGQRLTALQTAFSDAVFDRIIRRITNLPDRDYQRLHDTVAWLRTNPTSGLLLRQLPIEGIDTKWLQRHRGLVLPLLGDGAEPENVQPQDELGDDAGAGLTSSLRRRLHERLGLRVPPELIQTAALDPHLRAQVGGMRNFAASVDDLNQWSHHPRTVIILENKETGYAITDDLPGTVVLHGQGFNVADYARITWVRTSRVLYWGDIDAAGLQFVNDLRGYGITVDTVLMDTPTLTTYQHLATDGAGPQRTDLPHLSPTEADLYTHLANHAASHGTWLLLEQERIPWESAYQMLLTALFRSPAALDTDLCPGPLSI